MAYLPWKAALSRANYPRHLRCVIDLQIAGKYFTKGWTRRTVINGTRHPPFLPVYRGDTLTFGSLQDDVEKLARLAAEPRKVVPINETRR
ncbi:MAG TPA: hypothetical protein DIU18_06845 [Gemmatimonadetes bacterium]|nr:hypothetical protein [Gemmatimonadota bacterium]|tara:strand:+ start:183 stop:452 length:270 start_codon:yes stop_codon:yes gene_type:complete